MEITETSVSTLLRLSDEALNQQMLEACRKAGLEPKQWEKIVGDAAGLKKIVRGMSLSDLRTAVGLLKNTRVGKAIGYLLAGLS